MDELLISEPLGDALRWTGQMLFRPFSVKKWLALSVAAWLTLFGETGFNFNGNFSGFRPSSRSTTYTFGSSSMTTSAIRTEDPFDAAWKMLNAHLVAAIVIAIVAVCLAFGVYLLYRWLNSRGQFMMLDHVARNRCDVKAAWARQRVQGNSLFRFRILWDTLIFNAFLLALIVAALFAIPDFKPVLAGNDYRFSFWSIAAIGVALFLFAIIGVTLWVFGSFFNYMVIPVMYLREMKTWAAFKLAWRELFLPHFWKCILYFLLMFVAKLVQGIATAIVLMVIFIATCCTAAILSIIPILGMAVMYPVAVGALPVTIFERAYSLRFLGQFGAAYKTDWPLESPTGFEVIPLPPPLPDQNAPPPGGPLP